MPKPIKPLNRQKIAAKVKSYGGRLLVAYDKDGICKGEVLCEAPTGHHWRGPQVHEIVVEFNEFCPLLIAYGCVWDDIQMGIEPCGPECKWWDEPETESKKGDSANA